MIDKFYDLGKLFDAVHHIVGTCQKHTLSDFCFPGSEHCGRHLLYFLLG